MNPKHQAVGKQVYPIGKSTPDHRTPKSFLNGLGTFDLDVAASKENAICERYFNEEMNGLNQKWFGRVWCNPPYSEIMKWVEKAIEETHIQGNCKEVVLLLPSRTCTKWFLKAYQAAAKVQFIHGRLDFHGPNMSDREKRANAPFPSVLITIRGNWSVFIEPIVNMINREGVEI